MIANHHASFWRTIRYAHIWIPTIKRDNYSILGVPEVLLIRDRADYSPRTSWWRIPGGSIEAGETVEHALHREFLEETGCALPETVIRIENDGGLLAKKTRALLVVGIGSRPVDVAPDFKTNEVFEVRYFPIDALPFLGTESGAHGYRLDRFTYELLVACIRRNWSLLQSQGIGSSFKSII